MAAEPERVRGAGTLVALLLVGAAVSVVLGVYGREHTPTNEPISTFGFDTLLDMKSWLTTAALVLGVVQVTTAARIYERIGRGPSPRAVNLTHRLSGALAVLLSLPVAYHCLWSLGFGTYDSRVLAHSLFGCVFYGVFVTKMLALRVRRLPGYAVPLLGGALFTVLVGVWTTSALWFFTNQPGGY